MLPTYVLKISILDNILSIFKAFSLGALDVQKWLPTYKSLNKNAPDVSSKNIYTWNIFIYFEGLFLRWGEMNRLEEFKAYSTLKCTSISTD